MTAETPSNSARSPFFIVSDSGLISDLTELIADGAKLTVLFDKVVADWHISHREKWAYHRLRRQCLKWQKDGLLTYSEQMMYDSCFVGIEERPGIFIKAKTTTQNNPDLIKSLQNSKSVAGLQNGLLLEIPSMEITKDGVTDLEKEIAGNKLNWLPGGKIGWYREQAIKQLLKIRNPTLFVRERYQDGTTSLNPSLVKMQKHVSKLFEAWKQDCLAKQIVLKDQNTGKYLKLNYKTRFTDPFRHWENEKTYRTAVQKSTEMFETGVFITLTSDPQIHMRRRGEEFERHVKDPNSGTTYTFELTGKGGNLWSANRSESRAWRGWYERLCHRYKRRVPYIRVVEFQKNGLIHTHLLMFGIKWEESWEDLARDWGERYGQGIMNQVYRVKNVNGVWQWANKNEQPNDTRGRSPADYLGKYLKKASDIPTIKCPHCGQIVSAVVSGEVQCPQCHAKLHAPRDGRYMYWACGKRFFTISQCLREEDFDKVIQKEMMKELSPYNWEYLGAPDASLADDLIRKDIKKKGAPRITMDGWESPYAKAIKNKWDGVMKAYWDSENPDVNDGIREAIVLNLEQPPEEKPDIMTAEEHYQELLAIERAERKARRERIRQKKLEKERQNEEKSISHY